jgi:FkbM family methyltransferase
MTEKPFNNYAPSGFTAFFLKRAQAAKWRKTALIWRRLARYFHGQDILDAIVQGIAMRFHLGDNVSERKFLFLPQFFDAQERQIIADELPEQGVFIDIGANAGIYSLWAAQYLRANAGGRVLAIEPNPVLIKRLQKNIGFNGFADRIQIAPFGISSEEGTFPLALDLSNLGGSSLAQDSAHILQITCKPLYAVLGAHDITHIDMLKIDIEGAEDRALIPFFDQAPKSLYPRLIIIEKPDGRWREDLLLHLQKIGYQTRLTSRMNHVLVFKDYIPASSHNR